MIQVLTITTTYSIMFTNVIAMKRVVVVVAILMLLGGGIALALGDSSKQAPVAVARIEQQTPLQNLPEASATATATINVELKEAPSSDANPVPTQGFEAEDENSAQVLLQPAISPTPGAAEKLSQGALAAVKQLLDSPQSKNLDALYGAMRAVDSAIMQIQALKLPAEQERVAVAALLLARAHLEVLATQVISQGSAQPSSTPKALASATPAASYLPWLLGSSSDVQQLMQGLMVSASQQTGSQTVSPP
jgi:hypothetical protein